MADINIASFDVDARAAIAQTNQFIASIDSLEKELIKLQKEGKDTSAVQAQLAAATANLDKILSQETKTTRGNVAAVQAMIIANNKASQSTKQLTDSQTKLDTAQKKSAGSTAAFLARSKNLSGALTRGAAALGNFAGGFGLSGIALGALSSGLEKLIEQFGRASLSQQSLDNVNKAYTETVSKETAALQVNFAALNNTSLSLSQRKEALGELIAQFPEYFAGLDAEKSTVEALKLAYEGTAIAIKSKALESAFGGEREALTSKKIQAEIERERLARRLAIDLLKEEGRAYTETDIAIKKSNIIRGIDGQITIYQASQVRAYTDEIKESKAALIELDNVQKDLTKSTISEDDKITELKAKRAAKLREDTKRIEDINKKNAQKRIDAADKAEADAAKKATARREKAQAEAEKERLEIEKLNKEFADGFELRAKEKAEAEAFAASLGGLKKQYADLQNQIENQTSRTDFAKFQELTAQADALKKEIATLETALESYGKVAEEIRRPPADTTTFEREVERAKLALGELRTEQFESDLARAKLENDALQRAGGNAQKEAEVRKFWSKEAEKAKREQAKQTLILQIDLARKELVLAQQTGELFGQEATDAKNELLALELQLAELTNTEYTVNIDVNDEDAKKKLKETTLAAIDFTQQAADQTFAFFAAQNQQLIAGLDNAVSAQKNALDALLNNGATTNVELVRLEQERLDKLNAERKKAAEKEAIIAQAQIAVNLALAVSKAAVEGGGIASVFTIASLLAAATFGFIQAKQAAANAYAEGTLYVDDKRAPNGKDTVPAWLDKGEAVITKQRNKQYANTVRAVHFGEVPAEYLDKAIRDYKSGSHLSDIGLGSVGLSTRSTRQAREERANRNKSAQVLTVSGGTSRTELTAALNYIGASLDGLNRQKLSGANLLTVVQSRANNISKMKNKARGKHG